MIDIACDLSPGSFCIQNYWSITRSGCLSDGGLVERRPFGLTCPVDTHQASTSVLD